MLLSRQPRECNASVLCISLWMIYPNTLVSCRAAVDERGCGKVDNRRTPALTLIAGLRLSICGVSCPQCSMWVLLFQRRACPLTVTGVADAQLSLDAREYVAVGAVPERWWLPSLPSRLPSAVPRSGGAETAVGICLHLTAIQSGPWPSQQVSCTRCSRTCCAICLRRFGLPC
jgi:hypothetical protein